MVRSEAGEGGRYSTTRWLSLPLATVQTLVHVIIRSNYSWQHKELSLLLKSDLLPTIISFWRVGRVQGLM